jgi:hypothetical protein
LPQGVPDVRLPSHRRRDRCRQRARHHLPSAGAAVEAPALVTTTEALAGNSVQQRLGALLERAEVREALAARGVDPAQVEARVAALSDQEARLLAEQLDRLPAGASDVLGVLFAVFLILLITDILGLTKVFPFTKAIR